MSVKAKCLNYTGCLLAYRGEVVDLANNAPLVCPECGKPVTVIQNKGGGAGKAIAWLVVLAIVGAGLYFLGPKLGHLMGHKPAPPDEPTEIITTPTPPKTGGAEPTPPTRSATPEVVSTIPAATPSTPARIDLDIKKPQNQQVRDEVLKRIDVMPKVTRAQKDKLYNSVQAARSMGIIMTIPFASGVARLPASEIPALKAELDKPEIAKLRKESTYVFVVLGYADPKGDEAKNLQISQSRADSVLEAMRDKCGVENLMHSVAMGGSKILDAENLEKNRVVEVWAVLP